MSMNKDNFIFSTAQLIQYLDAKDIKHNIPIKATNNFSLLIPKYYIDLINWSDKNDPLMRMVLINDVENSIKDYQKRDPIGDHSHSPVPGIVHRYPDRCLLMLTNVCAVHCRFCFRKNLLSSNKMLYEEGMKYIENHPELWEIILSGGDPFMFTNSFLSVVVNRLNTISHVKVIRFHTRIPSVYPYRITKELTETLLQTKKRCIVVIHINHPREVTADFIHHTNLLKEKGIILLSQTVLLKEINNDAHILEELFKRLIEVGIKPYYLHHLDIAAGTHHFRISVQEGKQIMQQLRGHVSGICMPEYVIDTPGGYGKIPVFWFTHTSTNTYTASSFEGIKITYNDPIHD